MLKNQYHYWRPLALFCWLSVMLPLPGLAETTIAPGALKLDKELQVAAVPGDTADEVEELAGKGKGSRRERVIAPMPSRSPLLGWTLAVPAMLLYKPSFAEEADSTWMTGAMAFYAENESWGVGAFHRMSTGGDKWRLLGAAFKADLNYDFFGIGGDPDTSIPLDQALSAFMFEALVRTYPNLYVGLRGSYSRSDIGLRIPPDLLPPGVTPPDISAEFDLTTLAPRATYDTRDNEFFPSAGLLVDATIQVGREFLGSDFDYESHKLHVNSYRSLGESTVVATRVSVQYVAGDAPFFVYPAFGSGADLRGYDTGTYRDRFLVAGQVELRYRVKPRIGLAAFAGIGTVAPKFGQWGKSLPSVGGGIRWVIAPKNNMSLRFDIARGKDDTEFYVGLGEAF